MSKKAQEEEFQFHGWDIPNTTQVPDIFFDFIAPRLSEAELRCLIYILRRTYGFKKQSDAISLSQLEFGITTSDGKVLDYGTGMSRRGVMKGCAGLVEKGYVLKEQRRSELGDNDINVYRLRFREDSPPRSTGVGHLVPYGRAPRTPPVGNKVPPQETVKQKTVKQHYGGGVENSEGTTNSVHLSSQPAAPLAVTVEGVAKVLHDFGLSPDAANELAQTYPEAHILAKLDLVQWLHDAHPQQVRNNPAGFLRRAIERDFAPPADYRPASKRRAAIQAHHEADAVHQESLADLEQEHAQARAQREQQLLATYPPAPIPGTTLTTADAWAQACALLADELSGPNYQLWVKPAVLASCTDGQAVVVTPSAYQAEHLATRLHRSVGSALTRVLGQPIQCRYQTLGESH